ncbi:uncharacterized protein AM588_10011523 [Phytophthora nicotianae]|uniref:Uncharacterized protein n=1 Tax=Phytophthora nicotianae TaxID=4792 RepID=A0A0W8DQ27_PHYNI|nr:uncharacterized protein AM588_10011523 [Phytophthora nicotianae]
MSGRGQDEQPTGPETSSSDAKLLGDDAALEATSLEALESDFEEVLAELEGDKSLERFRLEYEKLHRALKKSNGQEKKLIKKCRELNAEIINNAAKVQTALKLSQEDQASIASLKKEMEKAWKMVDASHEKELRAKETIQQLKDEIVNLGRLVEQGTGLSAGQESMLKEVMRAKEELMRANEEHEANAKKDHERIQELHRRLADMDTLTATQKSDIQTLKDQLAMKAAEQEREIRRKERLDKEIKDVKSKLEKKTTEQAQGATELTRLQTQVGALEKQLAEARGTMDKYVRDYETLFGRTQKLTDLLNEQNDKTMQLEVERRNLENELKTRHDEIHRVKLEKGTVERKLDKEKRLLQQLEQKLEGEHTAKIVLQTQIKSMQHDLDQDKINEDHARTELEALEREKAMQIKQTLKAEGKVRRAQDEIKTNERVAKNLEQELAGFKLEAAKQRKLIYQLEKEREKYGMEAAEQRKLFLQSEEEGKLKEMRNHDLQKKVHEGETKLKQQQQLYEAVRSERNLYSKNLIESQDEIAEMKRKFKILTHQIEQLKEEVAAKDVALVKEHFDHQKVEKQKEQHKSELARLRALLAANEETINNQDAEVRKLSTLIRRMDDEALEQRKEYDQVINERDILGTQLIRRNDELALLYEKLKIQQSTLSKGEAQYQERLQDIRVLKLKVTDLKRELYIAKHQVGQADELKREVYHLQRELLQEKTKVKALSEELENPMNVHRWRKLEGSDPATYELLQKIQTLQKRLIQKTEEVVEKELARILEVLDDVCKQVPLELPDSNHKAKRMLSAACSDFVGEYEDELTRTFFDDFTPAKDRMCGRTLQATGVEAGADTGRSHATSVYASRLQHMREFRAWAHARNPWHNLSLNVRAVILLVLVIGSALLSLESFFIGWPVMGICLIALSSVVQRRFPQIFGRAFRKFISAFVVVSLIFFSSSFIIGTFVSGGAFKLGTFDNSTALVSSELNTTHGISASITMNGKVINFDDTSEYAACSISYRGLSVLDLALIADAAYGTTTDIQKSALENRFNGTELDDWKYVARNNESTDGQTWMEIYFPTVNMTVISVRGTASATDALEDMHFWFGICIMQAMNVFIPFLKQLPRPFVVRLLSMRLIASVMPSPVYTDVLNHAIDTRSRVGNNLVITGHSLGGAIAAMIGAKTKTSAVSFSGPGLLYSLGRFDITAQDVRDYVLTMKPRKDIVPQVDELGGLVQEIRCKKSSPMGCHSTSTHLCELYFSCGDPRQRNWSTNQQCIAYNALPSDDDDDEE